VLTRDPGIRPRVKHRASTCREVRSEGSAEGMSALDSPTLYSQKFGWRKRGRIILHYFELLTYYPALCSTKDQLT
jgi:hypothetical protein